MVSDISTLLSREVNQRSLRPIVAPRVRVRDEEDGAFVFVKDIAEIYELNSTAKRVLRLCDGTRTIEDILQTMIKEFDDTPQEIVRNDVNELLEFFEKIGCVKFHVK